MITRRRVFIVLCSVVIVAAGFVARRWSVEPSSDAANAAVHVEKKGREARAANLGSRNDLGRTAQTHTPQPIGKGMQNSSRLDTLQKSVASNMAQQVRQEYAPLLHTLALSETQSERLIDIVTTKRMKAAASSEPSSSPGDMRAPIRSDEVTEQQIASSFGQDVLRRYRDYERTLPDQPRMDAIARKLQEAGAPLGEGQRTILQDAMIAARQGFGAPTREEMQRLSLTAEMEKYAEWYERYGDQVLQQITGRLTAKQVRLIQGHFESVSSQQREVIEQMRAAEKGGDGAVAPIGFPVD